MKPAFLSLFVCWLALGQKGCSQSMEEAEESALHQAGLEQFLNVLRVIKNKKSTNSHALTSCRCNGKRKFAL